MEDVTAEYPGKTIDQIFPITGHISLIDENGRDARASLSAGDYTVRVKDYVPQTLERDGMLYKYKRRERGGYWATLVGISHLRGQNSTEVYSVVSGPGGVCCTNYSIVDVSIGRPKSIYHSEDFGSFREPMEIFDADGDGVYELMQWDSCFRYFENDCGSCSPQPRAYFKYDKIRSRYLPIAGIVQDFVKESHKQSDKWLEEKYNEIKHSGESSLSFELRRSALAYTVDLLYVGEERRAWKTFEKYVDDPKGETKREIKKRLADCKFYQLLKHH